MKQLQANLLKIESTQIDNFAGDTTGKSIIATSTGSAEKGETAQVFGQGGIINNPSKNTIGLRVNKGSLDIIVGQMNYQVPLPENQGETLIYSTDADGVVQSKILLGIDGTFIFNDGEDNAVRYSELETAFNQLKQDFDQHVTDVNTFISTVYGTHTHTVTTPDTINGTASPTTAQGTPSNPSTADITPSKIEEIKVP